MTPGRIDGVRRIAVLRPNALGDFVFALPALAALAKAYPGAEITLLGKPWHAAFLQGRPGPWDEVIALPPLRGVGAPPDAAQDDAQVQAFIAALRDRAFDIAIQLFGGGRYSNPFVRSLGARLSVGLRAPDAPALDRDMPYTPWRNERLRLLEVVSLLGAAPVDLAPPLAVTAQDEAALRAAGFDGEGDCGVLQPGASDPRRRWAPERFAAVGDALAEAGAQVVVHAGPDEGALAQQVLRAMRRPAQALQGLPLGALAALLARARLVVSNDTGPLHLAQAVGTPTVGIYWFMNLLASAPLVAGPHREAFATRTQCPVCGLENVHQRCGHEVSFVDDVSLDEVRTLALQAWLTR